jgi:hypothetical protein
VNQTGILWGRDAICDYLQIGKSMFYRLVSLGLPANNVTGRWIAHESILDEWFKGFCRGEDKNRDG